MQRAVLAAGQNRQTAHHGGAHDGRRCPHQQRVKPDARQRDRQFPFLAKGAAGKSSQDTGDQREIEAGDGDDVAGAGGGESLVQILGDAAFDSQENASQERGLGFRQHSEESVQGMGLEAEEHVKQPVGLVRFEHRHVCPAQQGVDVLTRQVLAVGEALEGRGSLQRTAGADTIPVERGGVDGGFDQHLTVNREGFPAGETHLLGGHTQVCVQGAAIRLAHDDAGHGDGVCAVVARDVVFINGGTHQ